MNGVIFMNDNVGVMQIENEEVITTSKVKRMIYLIVKRAFDIFCSIIGLILLIPVTWVVKICYMLTGDFKTIFYAQKRIGKDGKIFYLYKFRSMVPNADEILKELLENDKEAAREYKLNKKLENEIVNQRISLEEIKKAENEHLLKISAYEDQIRILKSKVFGYDISKKYEFFKEQQNSNSNQNAHIQDENLAFSMWEKENYGHIRLIR